MTLNRLSQVEDTCKYAALWKTSGFWNTGPNLSYLQGVSYSCEEKDLCCDFYYFLTQEKSRIHFLSLTQTWEFGLTM